jgi:alpha-beta hydrolase superfamily lysophospholipase
MLQRRIGRLCVGAGALLTGYVAVGSALVAPWRHEVRPLPTDLQAETVELASRSGAQLSAWLVQPDHPRAVVLALHGLRGDRTAMLSRARLLLAEGYAVLLPDLQAHGQSTGDRITFGFLEARDAETCLSYLEERFPGIPVGAIGVSMGGAALALAAPRIRLDAVVLESAYPTIDEAVNDRISYIAGRSLSRVLTPLLLLQLRPQLGITRADLRPIEGVKAFRCPVLILAGTADHDTTAAESRRIFAAAHPPKSEWLVPGARHVDLLRYDREGYIAHVLPFLREAFLQAGESGRGAGKDVRLVGAPAPRS